MNKHITKTVYLQGQNETEKVARAREDKITRVQKKIGRHATQSAAVRLMIDAYKE